MRPRATAPRKLWIIEAEETVFSAPPYLDVRKQRIRTDQDAVIDDYYQVTLPDFVICCALTAGGEALTLWQYKHGARSWGLTFPAGLIEQGEDAETAMRRELLEETGYSAGEASRLGRFVCSGNQGAGWATLFLFEQCRKVAEACSGDLESMELRLMTPEAIDASILEGDVTGLPHLAVWTAARHLHARAF